MDIFSFRITDMLAYGWHSAGFCI